MCTAHICIGVLYGLSWYLPSLRANPEITPSVVIHPDPSPIQTHAQHVCSCSYTVCILRAVCYTLHREHTVATTSRAIPSLSRPSSPNQPIWDPRITSAILSIPTTNRDQLTHHHPIRDHPDPCTAALTRNYTHYTCHHMTMYCRCRRS